ncbi:UDP-3-O-(3-hydroxymyristoyl)glucosamine N-acyltransferase [Thiohalobacter sp. IOR34]|nr:UDP-3-O-(3-hydroxymyristoyl)glucosamine N-acyltransferase [Thiohalobacter sp. IOR34]WJW76584.1 UDP-3-O-(3-hydroxymyristoyl)glucosamine N-acyltransferase [Thiohalobacter sp. IOR34]
MSLTLGELAERTGARLQGEPGLRIEGVCTLQHGRPDCISFLSNPSYRKYLAGTRAGAVILAPEDAADCPVPVLISERPYVTYARVAALLSTEPSPEPGVHPSAVIGDGCEIDASASIGPLTVVEDGVRIGARVRIGPGCVLGRGCRIGDDSRLVARVTLCHGVQLGRRCLVHPGAVIGSDGFGIADDGGHWVKVPQLGGVRIGDDVEIGANTTIDRGALEDTVIEEGVKLDNQIQVAHNVHIGAHTAIAGCVGISGSARIGSHCMLAGGVGVVGHLEIADHVVVTGMSMVTKSITEPGVYSSGLAAMPNEQWNKVFVRLRRLDEMARRLRKLEKKLSDEQ